MRQYTKEWLQELCESSYSYVEVLRKAGRRGGGAQQTLKKKIAEYGIDTSHFTGQEWFKTPGRENELSEKCGGKEKYSLEEVFIKDSPVTQKVLRGYVERHHIIEYKCQTCGCDGHWQDGEISLEIDHINGDNTDNQIQNLRYLCPNCHALTETYRGRNKALKNKCVESIHQPPKSE